MSKTMDVISGVIGLLGWFTPENTHKRRINALRKLVKAKKKIQSLPATVDRQVKLINIKKRIKELEDLLMT